MSRQGAVARMADPAGGVPQQLLPHMHLVSSYRYPLMNNLSHETAVEYLISAPKVVRELQTMHWMFLDGPPDGTVILVWQPLNHLGTNFASDGYVWADAEQIYSTEIRGYNLELYLQRCGYHPPNEQIATHCRKRYRLTPTKNPNANVVPCDPSLWIIHYSKTPAGDQIPANRILVTPQMQNILAQRRFLQSQGQLVRKEFMLHDRNSWPTINLPPQVGQQNFMPHGAPYANPMLGRQQSGPFYQQQQGQNLPGPQNKPSRSSRASATAAALASAAAGDYSLEEEEVSTGDMLDTITPRDISKMRYRHHHEWMDEIFGSPYSVKQIIPVDLGLGRKGELESLTAGFFDAPTGPSLPQKELSTPRSIGKMEAGKAEDFTNAVNRRVAEVAAEIEEMKERHAKRLEKMKRITLMKEAELALRDAYVDPEDVGDEFWRVEGHLDTSTREESPPVEYSDNRPKAKVDDIINNLQKALGRLIVRVTEISCVEEGGLQKRVVPPETTSEFSRGDIDMGEAGMSLRQAADSKQQPSPSHAASAGPVPTPVAAPTTQQTEVGKVSALPAGATLQTPSTSGLPLPTEPSKPDGSGDVEMGGVELANAAAATTITGNQTGEWVIVSKEDSAAPQDASIAVVSAIEGGYNHPTSTELTGAAAPAPVTAATGADIPVSELQGLKSAANTDLSEASALETSNFDDAAEFSNLDSAADALAAYGEQNDDLGMGDLDNSAFGEAFHASEAEREQLQDNENENEEIS
ncbi:SWI/SNF and RSC complex subunit Ssr4 [Histoplasma capsulatum var. duboisii H88]|uniref:SWI/SNF and RSC complex subunit Ssr4 n=1 Tax=Ajellomyces capsulatus (strain H88) TaxID=544711 RepID=A0A8A1LWL9_AJEC8|nr:SWI/SNF and RSC complex subunit Ssr4 [Histoplasma capsulatum var. duboisii H88]